MKDRPINGIPSECTTCCKNNKQQTTCITLCEVAENLLPQLKCWNNGKGYKGLFPNVNSDPITWNNQKSNPQNFWYHGKLLKS